jgi:hypothetical protein
MEKTAQTTIRMTAAEREAWEAAAKADGRTLSAWIGDEIDHDSIDVSADIELCEGCCRAQRGDAHACGPQRVRGIGNQRPERLFVVEEQVRSRVSRCWV